ncbi:M15 family metallopeptidase [Aquabacter cavernae]|uniref:M15 family metallopeptidase n=1 Tax=Aquabacter cavernae TaxID=2496029 RepID=UPI001FE1EED2|nr:M15 family metallopeptidase [Aquabacter cavernae]
MKPSVVVMGAALAAGLSGPAPAAEALPPGFVNVAEAIPDARFDIRYYSDANFVGTRIDGYEAPRCYLTQPAAEALKVIAQKAEAQGLGLLIFDCYRPARAVAHFARWAADAADQAHKAAYYPDIAKQDLFREGYIAERSGHSRGSTLDLTLFERATGRELDMGTPFDLFGPRSWTAAPDITPAQRANRVLLQDLMASGGFKGFDKEWWHFTLAGEPHPDTYFDFPIR